VLRLLGDMREVVRKVVAVDADLELIEHLGCGAQTVRGLDLAAHLAQQHVEVLVGRVLTLEIRAHHLRFACRYCAMTAFSSASARFASSVVCS